MPVAAAHRTRLFAAALTGLPRARAHPIIDRSSIHPGKPLMTAESFPDLMARLRAGDADAAARVFERFAHRLAALAQVHLDGRTRRLVDPEDVLQSVFRSFFARHADGQLDLADWDGLWALLVVLTLRKCGRK